MPSLVLSASEVAALLAMSPGRFRAWLRDGAAPAFPTPLPLPGHKRWSRLEVERFINGERAAS